MMPALGRGRGRVEGQMLSTGWLLLPDLSLLFFDRKESLLFRARERDRQTDRERDRERQRDMDLRRKTLHARLLTSLLVLAMALWADNDLSRYTIF